MLIYAICPLFIMLFSCVGACSLFSLVSWFTDCCYVVVCMWFVLLVLFVRVCVRCVCYFPFFG